MSTLRTFELLRVWDGLFHAFDWIMTVIGVVLLWGELNLLKTMQ
jgi:uncharacterized membrane protein